MASLLLPGTSLGQSNEKVHFHTTLYGTCTQFSTRHTLSSFILVCMYVYSAAAIKDALSVAKATTFVINIYV